MKYTRLGKSGLEISKLTLGGMSFGDPSRGSHAWTLPEEESRAIIKKAVEIGITCFDTANVYSDGSGEEILGRALAELCNRDEIVVATKVHGRMSKGPNGGGLSRKHIITQIDASLKRLGMDHVDLYQIHRFDPLTPVEETMEALHDLIKVGKVRYIGASSMYAWQFAKMQHAAQSHGWTQFISMQNHLNLLYREEEREMIPLCRDLGVQLLPWSPLARGRLTRPWGGDTARTRTDKYAETLYALTEQADRAVVDQVEQLAGRLGRPIAQVALAWVLNKPEVASPIIGATKAAHLDDAVAALDLHLSTEDVVALGQPYIPHLTAGHD